MQVVPEYKNLLINDTQLTPTGDPPALAGVATNATTTGFGPGSASSPSEQGSHKLTSVIGSEGGRCPEGTLALRKLHRNQRFSI